jgi:hypothetical protein
MSFAPVLLLFYRHLDLEGFGGFSEAFVYDVNVDVLSDGWIYVSK